MQRKKLAAIATATLTGAALMLPLTAGQVSAAPATRGDAKAPGAAAPDRTGTDKFSDGLSMPWQRKYEEIRQNGLEQRLRSGSDSGVQKVARGQFARTAQTGSDRIFVVLAEFGDTTHSAYCDSTEEGSCAYPYGQPEDEQPVADPNDPPVSWDGPGFNEIPKPNRKTDNSTLWDPDYDRAYYQNMYFNRMQSFYEKQSLGKYSFTGDVTEVVHVPFNEARYGRDFCGDIVCNNTWFLLRDALSIWTQDQLDAGKSMQQIQAYLKTFDQQDRYDFDGDGDFNEPDGYIDHFQIVHAGGDEADGDDQQKGDAIWSHRWYAQVHQFGSDGPDNGGDFGGINIGEGGASDGGAVNFPDNKTGVWVGDYTIQPENGGLSVFAHEYGHDLGLPDLYDTSGNTGGAENSVGWWSLMSQSRGTLPGDDGIGDRPMPFGAWDKFQLGWLDYKVVRSDRSDQVRLRPGQATSGKGKNGAIVLLPDKEVTTDLGAPCGECGDAYYYSGQGDDLNNTMTRDIEAGGELTAKTKYDIEEGYDYAYLESSSDGGDTWERLETNRSSDDPAEDNGISGSTGGQWVNLTATVPADADMLRFSYITDGGVAPLGFMVDNIAIDGTDLGTAETGPEGWAFDGFRTTTGSETSSYLNAYFVDNRTYQGLDKPLSHLYNFGFTGRKSNYVEFLHNQKGALISYWDTSVLDNNVGDHPGSGEILPVDANPTFVHTPNGEIARPRINSWNSTFSKKASAPQFIHFLGQRYKLPGNDGTRTFNDNKDWWFASDEHGTHEGDHFKPGWYGVDVPKTGTTVKVLKMRKNGTMEIGIN